jgi:hypothetical protein
MTCGRNAVERWNKFNIGFVDASWEEKYKAIAEGRKVASGHDCF